MSENGSDEDVLRKMCDTPGEGHWWKACEGGYRCAVCDVFVDEASFVGGRPSDTTQQDEFEKRCNYLNAIGVGYTLAEEWRPKEPPRSPHPLRLFRSVRLPFSAHEWVQLCQSEGQFYMGGCCGQLSYLQDMINHVFRFDAGIVECRMLAQIAEAASAHEGFELFIELPHPLDEAVEKFAGTLQRTAEGRVTGEKLIDPWVLLPLIWHIVKDFCAPERALPSAKFRSEKGVLSLNGAVHLLSNGLSLINLDGFFSDTSDKPESQAAANRLVLLSRILPALKVLNEHIGKLAPPPLDGFALVRRKEPETVLDNGYGHCIYGTEAEAQKLIDLWAQEEGEHEGEVRGEKAAEFRIRAVRVTAEKGIEFTGDET